MDFIKRHWPLFAGLGVCYLLVLICLLAILNRNAGHFVYTLDDPYIHMSIAKNFARHGVWGITRYFFTSSSSSLIWTLLIAVVYFIFGINDLTPFILTILISTGMLVWIYHVTRTITDNKVYVFSVLTAVTVFTSLPGLIFMGMEHVLHAWMTIMFAYYAAYALNRSTPPSRAELIRLLVLAPLVILSRFEGLFLVFVVCCLYMIRKRFVQSIVIGCVALLPIVIFGFISVSKGWMFLPNSVMLKGSQPGAYTLAGLIGFFNEAIDKVLRNPYLLRTFVAGAIMWITLYRENRRFWLPENIMLLLLGCTMILHVMFAQLGWFFRYEAYLVAFGIFTLSVAMLAYIRQIMQKTSVAGTSDNSYVPVMLGVLFVFIVIVLPFDLRSSYSITKTPVASNNIYDQQYQMARFLKRYYNKMPVALNDVGAVNYYADLRCLDLWGLGNMQTAKLRMDNRFYVENIDAITRMYGIKIAIVYEHWFPGLPDNWVKVADWMITDNFVCGGSTVSFYAIDPQETNRLSLVVKEFSKSLPHDVRYRFHH